MSESCGPLDDEHGAVVSISRTSSQRSFVPRTKKRGSSTLSAWSTTSYISRQSSGLPGVWRRGGVPAWLAVADPVVDELLHSDKPSTTPSQRGSYSELLASGIVTYMHSDHGSRLSSTSLQSVRVPIGFERAGRHGSVDSSTAELYGGPTDELGIPSWSDLVALPGPTTLITEEPGSYTDSSDSEDVDVFLEHTQHCAARCTSGPHSEYSARDADEVHDFDKR